MPVSHSLLERNPREDEHSEGEDQDDACDRFDQDGKTRQDTRGYRPARLPGTLPPVQRPQGKDTCGDHHDVRQQGA